MFLVWLLFSNLAYSQQGCLNLNGYGEGPCVYESQNYGKLEGSIDFNFQQDRCDQIILNGHKISIPGKLELRQQGQGKTTLDFQWKDSSKKVLLFKYEMISYQGSQIQDHVLLNGQFSSAQSYLQLFQTGTVDRDPVRIQCRLRKWN